MRLLYALLFVLAAIVLAKPLPLKTVIVSYPKDTPSHVIDKAMDEIKLAGGVITHEYSLIKGFAAKVSQTMINNINTMAADYAPIIEDDNIITISNPSN